MISIIIPTYNRCQDIACLVHKVLMQDYTDIELIVVNDGSRDDTAEALAQIKDFRLKVINKANGSVSSARNTGIDAARGKYITYIDDDIPN